MATTIITKNGSGAPAVGDLVQGELAVDLTNKTLYSKDSSGNVFKVGDTGGGSSGTFTDLVATDSFTSPGIDDNATSTAVTITDSATTVKDTLKVEDPTRPLLALGETGVNGTPSYLAYDVASKELSITAYGTTQNGEIAFETGGSVERMRIDSTGNVGIGTDDPTASTVVIKGDDYTGAPTAGTPGTLSLYSGNQPGSGGSISFGSLQNPEGFATIKGHLATGTNNTLGSLDFYTRNDPALASMTHRMRISYTGNVGIGTDNPTSTAGWARLLEISGATAATKYTNGSANNGYSIGYSSGAFRIWDEATSSWRMTIDAAGSVLVNNTAYGNLGQLVVQQGAENTGIAIVDSTASDTFTIENNAASCKFHINTGKDFVFSNSASDTERMRISAAGVTTVTGSFLAAQPGAGANAFAAGPGAGINQGTYGVAVGFNAGRNTQGSNAVAIGSSAAETTQGANGVAIGNSAGLTTQGEGATALGRTAGRDNQGSKSVAMGWDAGRTSQGGSSVAVGNAAGQTSQGASSTAVGPYAGYDTQGVQAVAVGYFAGNSAQGSYGTAVGREAGKTDQGASSVAVGLEAGFDTQGSLAVAYGRQAGRDNQGASSVAIGARAGHTNQGANGIIINSSGVAENITGANHIMLTSGSGKYFYYNGTNQWTFNGGDVVVPNDHLLVGRTSVSAAATDHGWQVYNTGIVYQYADAATSTDVHRWYNGAGSLVASINARGEGFFLGGATYSGPLKADEIIQDGAPVVDSLQIIRAFMKLRAATADPDSTVEELREKLKTAVDDIIDQFQDQIDNMPTPLED